MNDVKALPRRCPPCRDRHRPRHVAPPVNGCWHEEFEQRLPEGDIWNGPDHRHATGANCATGDRWPPTEVWMAVMRDRRGSVQREAVNPARSTGVGRGGKRRID